MSPTKAIRSNRTRRKSANSTQLTDRSRKLNGLNLNSVNRQTTGHAHQINNLLEHRKSNSRSNKGSDRTATRHAGYFQHRRITRPRHKGYTMVRHLKRDLNHSHNHHRAIGQEHLPVRMTATDATRVKTANHGLMTATTTTITAKQITDVMTVIHQTDQTIAIVHLVIIITIAIDRNHHVVTIIITIITAEIIEDTTTTTIDRTIATLGDTKRRKKGLNG